MSREIEQKVAALIAPVIEKSGYDLVRVQAKGAGGNAALQVMAERRDGGGMKVEDCAAISRQVTALLDADKDLADRFELEVSSPGIDRPLVKPQDYDRFTGHVAKIELGAPLDGQKRFQGRIVRASGEAVKLLTDKGEVQVPFAAIDKAKLVITDELMQAAARGQISH